MQPPALVSRPRQNISRASACFPVRKLIIYMRRLLGGSSPKKLAARIAQRTYLFFFLFALASVNLQYTTPPLLRLAIHASTPSFMPQQQSVWPARKCKQVQRVLGARCSKAWAPPQGSRCRLPREPDSAQPGNRSFTICTCARARITRTTRTR